LAQFLLNMSSLNTAMIENIEFLAERCPGFHGTVVDAMAQGSVRNPVSMAVMLLAGVKPNLAVLRAIEECEYIDHDCGLVTLAGASATQLGENVAIDLVETMHACGIDIFGAADEAGGRTPLFMAIDRGKTELACKLIHLGADPMATGLVKDKQGRDRRITMLDFARSMASVNAPQDESSKLLVTMRAALARRAAERAMQNSLPGTGP
jgi:hypothetical protein